MGFYRSVFSGFTPAVDLTDNGFLGLKARAFARLAAELGDAQRQIDNDAVPAYMSDADGTIRSRTSPQGLDDWAVTFGLPAEVTGKLGRRGPTRSSGGSGIPTTTLPAILIPLGETLVDGTGRVTIETTAAMTTDGPPNTRTVFLRSVSTGLQANISVGSVLTWVSPPAGVSPTLTLLTALGGGKDRENDSDLLARILDRLQNPPRGGTAADYRFWALASTDPDGVSLAVEFADVHPVRSGGGTVDIFLLLDGEGVTRLPPAGTIADTQTFIDKLRPVTATANVAAPIMPAAKALCARVTVEPHPAYEYDWDYPSPTIITACTGTALECAMAPTPLQNAVAAGKNPRIQIILSGPGGPVRPFQTRVTAITGAGPQTLTLETAPPVDPIDGTDVFWSGGPVVDSVADSIATYVSNLRTSRQMGYADPNELWDYKVSLGQIAKLTLQAKDTNGAPMVATIPNIATTGILIAVGAGAFAPLDYEPLDTTGLPEVAYLRQGGLEVVPA